MYGTTAFVHSKVPRTLTDITFSNSSLEMSVSGFMDRLPKMPALFTNMSMRPHRDAVASTIALTLAASVTSHLMPNASPPADFTAATDAAVSRTSDTET